MNPEENKEAQIPQSEEEKQKLIAELKKASAKPRLYYGMRDTRKIPKKQPGDGYIVAGSIIGFFAGALIGGFTAQFIGFIGVFTGIILGIFLGSLLGTYVGGLIKKRVNRKKQKLESHYDAIISDSKTSKQEKTD